MAKKNRFQPRRVYPKSSQKIEHLNKNKDQVREYFNDASINIDYSILKEDNKGKTILITSGLQDEGRTFCSMNLAKSYGSITDTKVLLIDCDLDAPELHRYLNIPCKPGLTDFLSNRNSFSEICRYNREDNYYVITSGTKVSNLSVFLSSKSFRDLLEKLEEEFNYIIIDTAPVLQVKNACSFASYTDGIVIVTRAAQTTKPNLKLTIETLQETETIILGVLLNDVNYMK